jgi:EcsC protein family
VSRVLGTDWLLHIVGQANPSQVAKTVAEVRSQLPAGSTAMDIAQELTRRKALLCGGLGLAAGLLPPGVNLAAGLADAFVNIRFQVELVYEIACVYGLDLHSADRKGEALMVLAAGFGAEQATTTSLQFAQRFAVEKLSEAAIAQLARVLSLQIAEQVVLRGIPLLGACAGAGMNAAFVTLVGNAAQRFYGQTAR